MSQAWIIGHRGVAGLPENTIASFERAIEMGVDAIELDVRQSADGKLVVVHDSVVGDHSVQSTPYEKFRIAPEGFEIPLLEEVLEQVGKRTFLDIEFKHAGFEAQAVELIKKYTDPAQVMVSAFDTKTLEAVDDLFPELQIGYIYNRTQDEESRHNCPIDVVIPQFRLASRQLIEEVHEEGLRVWAWTVNEENEIQRLLALGVDGLITDHPERVAKALGR
jgi:glycerophosphoryl diester phosphodiesterase